MKAQGGDCARVALGGWGHGELSEEGKVTEASQVNHDGGMGMRRRSRVTLEAVALIQDQEDVTY
jgi:hypothetical protein